MAPIADELDNVRSSKEEIEEETKEAVEEVLSDSDLISVDRIGNANMEESVKLQLDFSVIEDKLEEAGELEGLEFSISGSTLQVMVEGNSRF